MCRVLDLVSLPGEQTNILASHLKQLIKQGFFQPRVLVVTLTIDLQTLFTPWRLWALLA